MQIGSMADGGEAPAFVPTVSTRAVVAILRYGPRHQNARSYAIPMHAMFVQQNPVPITWYKAEHIWLCKRRFHLNHTFPVFLAACQAEGRIVTWTTDDNTVWLRAA